MVPPILSSQCVKVCVAAWTSCQDLGHDVVKHNLLLVFSSTDRSFTPTHHSYYSPKHDGTMEEMLTSQQVPDWGVQTGVETSGCSPL